MKKCKRCNRYCPDIQLPSVNLVLQEAPGSIIGIKCGNCKPRVISEGLSDVIHNKKMIDSMLVRIGSITKTFTATVILQLIRSGLLNMNDEARDYISDIPDGITIKMLGNMTSGLYNYTESEVFTKAIDANPEKKWSPLELLHLGLNGKRYFLPGEGWYYSNTNYIALGLIAEKVSGQTMEALYRDLIFEPLDLENTFIPSGVYFPDIHSQGYMYGYNNPTTGPEGVFRDVTDTDPSYASYAGYLISSIFDIIKYAKPFVNGDLIGKEQKLQRDNSFVGTKFGSYGFGIAKVGDNWYGHDGTISGFQSMMLYNPERDITVVVSSNLQNRFLGGSPASDIANAIIKDIESTSTTCRK